MSGQQVPGSKKLIHIRPASFRTFTAGARTFPAMIVLVLLTLCCTFAANPDADFQQIDHVAVPGSGHLMDRCTNSRADAVRTDAVDHMLYMFLFQTRICTVITRCDAGCQFF